MQIAPGNRDAVHHVLLFLDASGASAALDGKDGKPGYDCFGGPGDPHHHAGEHQHGVAEADQTKVGLYFTQEPPKEELFYVGIENDRFATPAGERSFEVVAVETIPAFVWLDQGLGFQLAELLHV